MDQIHRSNGQAANQNGLSRDRHRSLPFVDDPSDCLKKRRISSAPGKAVVEEDPVSQKPLPSPGNEESFRGRRSSSSLGPDCKGRRSCSTSPQMVPGGFSCDASCKREADDSGAVLSEDDVELPLELEWKEDEEEEEDEELLGDEEQINQKIRALINANKISTAGEIPEDKFKFVRQTDGKPLFLCLTCPYHTNRRSNLKRHLLIHSGEKPFKCPLCQNGFRSTGNLRDHLKAHHNESKDEKEKRQSHSKHHTVAFFCRECGSRFSSLLELETHLDVHRGQEISPSKDVERKIWGVKVFLCNYCSYRTERTSNLKRHMRTHFASGQLDSSTSSTASAGSFSSSSKTPTPPPGASPSPGATRSVSEPPHSISPILSTSSPVSPQTPFSTPLGPIRNRSCSATAGTCASFTRKRTRPLSKCSFSPSPSPSPILVKIKAEDIVAFIASSPLVAPAPAVPSPTPDQARDQGGRGKDASANTHVKAETGGSKDLSVPQKAVVASLPIPQVVAPTHWKRRLFRVTGGVCSAPASPLSPAEDGTISPPLRPRRPDSMPCPLTERRTDACHLPSNHTSSAFRSVDRDTEQHQASSSTGTSPLPILSMISPPQTEPMALVVTPRPIASEAASTPASPAMLTSTDSVSSLRRARKKRDPPQEQQTQPQPPVKRREEALCRDPNPFFCPYCVEARKTRAARITHIAVCHPTKKQIVEDLMICSQETEHQRCTKEDLDALYLSSSHGNRINLGGGSNTYLGSAGVTSGLLNPRLPTQAEKDRKNDSLNNLLLRIKSGTTAGHPSAFVPVPPSSSACVSRISQNEEMFQKLVEQMSEDIAAKKRRQHQSPGGGGLASPSPPAPGPLCPERPEHRMTMRRGSDNTDTIRSAAALLELGNISVQRRASVSVPVKRPTATVRPVPVSRAAGGGDHGATRHKDVVSLTSTGSCKADVVESIFAPSTELVVGKEEDGSKRKGKQSSRFRTFAGDLVHLNPLPYECPVCSVFFPSLTMLRMHSQRVHASDTEDSEVSVKGAPSPVSCESSSGVSVSQSDPLTITLKVPDEEEEEGETQSKRRRHSRDLSGSSLSTTVSEGTTDLERALRNSVSGTAISVEVVRRPPSVPRCPSSKSPINAEAATIATVNCDKCKEPVRATVSDLLLHRPVCDANQRKGKQGPPTSATGSSVLLSALQRALTKKEADNDNCDSPAPVDFSQPLSCPICPTGVPHTHITPASVLEVNLKEGYDEDSGDPPPLVIAEEEDSQRASDPEQLLRQQRRKGLPKRTSSRGSMDVDESPGSPVLLDLSRKERVTPPADSKEQRLLLLEHVLKRQQESGGCSDDSPALISEVKGQEQSCVFCLLPFPTASLGDHIRVAHTRFDASKRREERQTQSLQQEAARRKREAGGSTGSTSPAPSDVDGWYNCPFCDFSSPSKAELYLHVTEHLFCGNSGYRCPFCSQEESNRFVFAQHVSCHIGLDKPSVYKCPFCDFICQTRELLASHKQRHVFEVFKCEDCPFVTSSRYQLTRHTRNQHPWVKAHRCDQCSFRSHDAQTLRNHMYLHRLPNTQNISIEAVGSGHVCEFCSQLFLTTKTLAHHVKYDCRSKGGASGGSSEPPEKPVVEEDGEITPDFEKERIQRLVDGKPVFEKLMKKKIWLATTSSDGQSSATTSSVSVGGPSTGLSTTPVIPRVLNEQDLEEVEAALSRPKKVSKKEVSKQLSRAAKEILKKKTQVEEEQAAQLLLAMRGGLNPAVRSSTTANTGSTGEAGAVPIGASTSTSSILKKVLIKNPDDLAETANEGQGKEDDGTQKGVSGLKDERLWLTLPPPQDDTTREGSSPEADEAGILLRSLLVGATPPGVPD